MKIKEAIKNLKVKRKLKNDNNKNIARNLSGAVEGSVGSVQFQIVPCSSLYFSRSIGPFQWSWWWGTAPSEIRGESTKQYSRQTPVFFGGEMLENIRVDS